MKITESTKERIRQGILTTMLGGLGYVSLSIVQDASQPFASYVVPAIGSSLLLWLSVLLLIGNLFLGTWLVILIFGDAASSLKKKYLFLERRGFYEHRESKHKACANCLGKGLEFPLAASADAHGEWWMCVNNDCRFKCERLTNDK